MTRFLSSGNRYLRQGARFVGQGRALPAPLELEYPPADFEGAVAYGDDGKLYYSDGESWLIPQDDVEISRPTARPPANSVEQTQLRLSNYRSPAGLVQAGILIQISTNGTDFNSPITRTVLSDFANLYQIIYPEDGFEPGDEIFWRGAYFADDGTQSDFSLPLKQVFPEFIDNPTAVTRQGAVTGTVELSPFTSPLGLDYVETQIRFWNVGDDPESASPVATVTSVSGAVLSLPTELVEGQEYQWSGRYGGRVGGAGPVLYTEFTTPRFILKGVNAMILVYDPALALNRTINLPMGVYGGIVNVNVDWGDGTSNTYTTGGIRSKTYDPSVTGLVTVIISGQLEQYGGNTNIQGLVRVDNIGVGLGLTSLREMFRNVTSNTIFCTPNIPPTVKSIRGMFFSGNPGFPVQDLIVSDVEDFSFCFENAASFNQPLALWDVGKATNMRHMFWLSGFNHPIGNWDVSNVTDMLGMLRCPINHPLNSWNVSKVTNMRDMFNNASSFNQPLNNWDVSSVTDFSTMFQLANSFNQDISSWDVSSGLSFNGMFLNNNAFNPLTLPWDLSNALTVAGMFQNTQKFNPDLTGMKLPQNCERLFYFALGISNNASISSLDTSGVTNMKEMFGLARNFNTPLDQWDVSNVVNMEGMFLGDLLGNAFNRPINSWDVSNVTNMRRMFASGISALDASTGSLFNQPLDQWDVSNVSDMEEMFAQVSATTTGHRVSAFNQDISMWKLRTAGVNLTNMFFNGTNLRDFSTENYSKLLAGWANSVTERNGPFNVVAGFGDRIYNNTERFPGTLYPDAVVGRAYFTNSNRLTVSSASTADADGTYLFNAGLQLYLKANDWYFFKNGTVWELRDEDDVVQATQQDAANLGAPQLVETWNGVLASATVRRTGAAWTITDGGLEV